MDAYLSRFKDPALRKRMAPYAQHVIDTARAHGVDPAFVFSTIAAESSGQPLSGTRVHRLVCTKCSTSTPKTTA
jgi:hypothetical protein